MLHLAVSSLFVTMASTETLNSTMSGVICVPALPVPKVAPQIVSFSKTNLTISIQYTNKVATPI